MSRPPPKSTCRHRWREQLRFSFSGVSVTVNGHETVRTAAAGGRIEVCTRCGDRREVRLRRAV